MSRFRQYFACPLVQALAGCLGGQRRGAMEFRRNAQVQRSRSLRQRLDAILCAGVQVHAQGNRAPSFARLRTGVCQDCGFYSRSETVRVDSGTVIVCG